MSIENNNNETDVEEEEMTVMQAFEIAWFKFVNWACEEGKKHLPGTTAAFLESSIRQPPMLALLTINDMLKQRPKTKDSNWEEVENRREIIRRREWAPVQKKAQDLLLLSDLTIPKEVQDRLFQFANVILDLIDEMN